MKYKKAAEGGMGLLVGVCIIVIIGFILATIVPAIAKQRSALCLYPGMAGCAAKAGEEGQAKEEPEEKKIKELVKGEISSIALFKKEDEVNTPLKPTSDKHCSVTIFLKNIGEKTWEESDMIRAALFCKQRENEVNIIPQISPVAGYIKDLAPGKVKELAFPYYFPNNCLQSSEEYSVVLYSNCKGYDKENICSNFEDPEDKPTIMSYLEFRC